MSEDDDKEKGEVVDDGADEEAVKDVKIKFEPRKWNAVALWSYDIMVETCSICRELINDICIECQANQVTKPLSCIFFTPKKGFINVGGVYDSVGVLQSRVSFSLYQQMVEKETKLPTRQHGMGIYEMGELSRLNLK